MTATEPAVTSPLVSVPPTNAPAKDPAIATASGGESSVLTLAIQALKFGAVGGLGFLWDASTVYALRPLIGFTAAALSAYLVAATMNWLLNRLWTFRGRGDQSRPMRQWLRFLGANALGFAINRSVVFALVWSSPICLAYPVLALAAGALAGMVANFALSKRVVFRA